MEQTAQRAHIDLDRIMIARECVCVCFSGAETLMHICVWFFSIYMRVHNGVKQKADARAV